MHTGTIVKKNPLSLLLAFGISLCLAALASCSETEETDEYANWQERNEAYIDSIAKVCSINADGKWIRILSFTLNEKDINGNTTIWDNENYVYCHIETIGEGTTSPIFTDTVCVNYRGRLIPSPSYPEGLVFDQSFKGKVLDPLVNVPKSLCVGGVKVGWSTALQKMHAGDIWKVYIPSHLGYGASAQTSIPAHSTLIFDINLTAFYPREIPVPAK